MRPLLILFAFPLLSCAAVDHARTSERFPITAPAELSSPIIDPVVRDCARAVHVRGFLPGALVQVWSNDFEEIGRAAPPGGEADVPLRRPLDVEDLLTATQTVGGQTSLPSPVVVTVERWPTTPGPPVLDGEAWSCGRVVRLSGLEEGCRAELYEDDQLRGAAFSPGRSLALVADAELRAGASITASQESCSLDVEAGGPRLRHASARSAPIVVGDVPRGRLLAPSVDGTTTLVGADTVAVDSLLVGAGVHVFVDGVLAGDALATGPRTAVPLRRPLEEGARVEAEQELCELSPRSEPVPVQGKLGPPELLGPICEDDPWVDVRGAGLNASVVVLQRGRIVGSGGAQEGVSRIGVSGLIPGLPVRAAQYYGDEALSPDGPELRVCCCGDGCTPDLAALRRDDPERWAADEPPSCKPSRDPLFAPDEPVPLAVELSADWEAVNGPGASAVRGTIRAGRAELPVEIRPRADERFARCTWRPVELVFDRLQVGGPFDGHRRLTLVPPCEAGDASPQEERRRLLTDYTLHKVLQRLDGAGLDARLADAVFRAPDGAELLRAAAYFEEEHHAACERCGWVREADDPALRSPDPASRFAAELVDRFVSGVSSGREPIACADSGSGAFFLPWDWAAGDLFSDPAAALARARPLGDFLRASAPASRTREQAWHIAREDEAMRRVIVESPLDAVGRQRMLGWFDASIKTLQCFLGFQEPL